MESVEAVCLYGGIIAGAILTAVPLLLWFRLGRDPAFTDDDSVLMPAPPPDFTPGMASIILHGSPTKHTIAAALLDLASDGRIEFEEESGPLVKRAGIRLSHRDGVRGLLPEEDELAAGIAQKVRFEGAYLPSILLGTLSPVFARYTAALDARAVDRGWFRWRSSSAISRSRLIAGLEALAGLALIGWVARADTAPGGRPLAIAAGGLAMLIAASVTYAVSSSLPARTVEGARLAGWLAAYRRTMKASIAQAASIDQLVDLRPLPWVGTPSEEVAWAVAFGLEREIDGLIAHSLTVSETGGWPMGIRDWFSVL